MITFGFYNSMNGDRKYDAVQLSSVFDGLITDGVFATIGTAFAVTAGEGRTVNVGTGKAWFNHTWTVNDAVLPIEAPMSEILMDRIDAVVLEIDASEAIRANGIKIIQGTPGTSPAKPAMAEESTLHQYPFCYIYRKAGSTGIDQADIENAIGTSSCPFVTGILKTVNVDNLLAQWNAQFGNWFTASKNLFSQEMTGWNGAFNTWFKESKSQFSEELVKWDEEFDDWFNNVKAQLSGDVAANLQTQISNHVGDTDSHVKSEEKSAWNAKASAESVSAIQQGLTETKSSLNAHTGNGDIHVTAADKTKWNGYQTIHTLSYSKSGTQHRLTGLSGLSGTLSCVFKATAAFAAGDTFTVDGTAYAVQLSNGETAEDNLFVNGASILIVVDTAGKKVNFKKAGGRKLPAGTVVLKTTTSTTFVVPENGDYKITVVGAGGLGGWGYTDANAASNQYKYYSGGGGGSGGVAKGTFTLKKGASYAVTVTSSNSSFGSLISATAGQEGSYMLNSGGVNVSIDGGKGGTASGGSYSSAGQSGLAGTEAYASSNPPRGGSGGAYSSYVVSQIPLLSTTRLSGSPYNTSAWGQFSGGIPGENDFGLGGGGAVGLTNWQRGNGASGLVLVERA